MSTSLARALTRARPLIWLDFHAYVAELFRSPVPWLDQTAFAAFHAQAQGLLRSDVIALPVEPIADALIASDSGLRTAMAAKSRSVYPLRRLLEDTGLRKAVASLLLVLRASHAERPLALAIPSPRRWFALAYEAAHGVPLDAHVARDADEIDGASVYIADFLRAFAESGVDVLLLCETPGQAPVNPEQLVAYQSVINSARHYRWEIGLLDAGWPSSPPGDVSLDFCVAPGGTLGKCGGSLLGRAFWEGADASAIADGHFYYAVIPAGATPERVLERLAVLRACTAQSGLEPQ